MAYDPDLRRNTPLAAKLIATIHRLGPIPIDRYMRDCLFDPDHGYYKTATVFGRDGDFITAPEISQAFGELIGLWCVAVWDQMGRPQKVQLVELGGGRGTLLKDALRAAQKFTAFFNAVSVAIIDTHPGLKDQQTQTLKSFAPQVSWPEQLFALEPAPTLLIANEFVDCLPIEQFVATPHTDPGWQRRHVGLDDANHLQFTLGRFETPAHAKLPDALHGLEDALTGAQVNEIIETRTFTGSEVAKLQDFVFGDGHAARPFAGLFVDYGHTRSSVGDTLQAVRGHRFEHPLTSPGEADLTAHVDFEQFAKTLTHQGFATDGPVTQGAFLGQLGLVERAAQLIAHNPDHAPEIESAIARLMSPTGMGGRFQALAIRTPNLAPLPGLAS